MMSRGGLAIGAAAACLTLGAGQPTWAGPATDQLREHVSGVIKILADPDLKAAGRSVERRAAIRKVASEIFDFTEITKRSLGRHWHARTPGEREEIIQIFGGLLERSYFTKLEAYSGEKVVYLSESGDDGLTSVRTKIISKQGTEIPVEYRMLRRDERWRVYDVTIEGVSLVANYRAQFDSIIQRSSYPELVQKLKARLNEAEAKTNPTPQR